MRAYPKGLRLNSSNLNPSVFWRAGVQIVALNWQRWDGGMMQNEAMFANTAGWVLKPEGYRGTSDEATQKTAITHHNLDLSIEFFAGQDIPIPLEDDPKDFKPYVKVVLHVETHEEREGQPIPGGGKRKGGEFKKKTKTQRTTAPDFGGEIIKFEGIQGVTEELTFVRYVMVACPFSLSNFPFLVFLYHRAQHRHAPRRADCLNEHTRTGSSRGDLSFIAHYSRPSCISVISAGSTRSRSGKCPGTVVGQY